MMLTRTENIEALQGGASLQTRLDLLREALPYIQRFKGKTFVVKLSGKVTEEEVRTISEEFKAAIAEHGKVRVLIRMRRMIIAGSVRFPDLARAWHRAGPERDARPGRKRVLRPGPLDALSHLLLGALSEAAFMVASAVYGSGEEDLDAG